ncbi:Rrf2 family transcriptional regulator [Enterococcus sp. BWB1-3]|uniref:Rrf2 family transcriptional regulator n=1 Tax=Enterococcus sp. BWB1-3 TaxID=2787713 RepID=UPI0019242919|nr:Rrf2 family transcriptional regulator [Enterococcus sp. BWB1-3]MBL1230789.1 Rrf2 family transcriptional regulator [Enterococcus sp. BWB1-3]
MKYSVKFSDAIHILAYIEIFKGTDLSSEVIATSVETNAVSVRKIMSQLKKSGLIISHSGKAVPKLSRKPEKISLYDIYRSVESHSDLFHVDTKTAPGCIVGGNIQDVLLEKYDLLQQSVENEMKKITLRDIIGEISEREIEKHPENRNQVRPFL